MQEEFERFFRQGERIVIQMERGRPLCVKILEVEIKSNKKVWLQVLFSSLYDYKNINNHREVLITIAGKLTNFTVVGNIISRAFREQECRTRLGIIASFSLEADDVDIHSFMETNADEYDVEEGFPFLSREQNEPIFYAD